MKENSWARRSVATAAPARPTSAFPAWAHLAVCPAVSPGATCAPRTDPGGQAQAAAFVRRSSRSNSKSSVAWPRRTLHVPAARGGKARPFGGCTVTARPGRRSKHAAGERETGRAARVHISPSLHPCLPPSASPGGSMSGPAGRPELREGAGRRSMAKWHGCIVPARLHPFASALREAASTPAPQAALLGEPLAYPQQHCQQHRIGAGSWLHGRGARLQTDPRAPAADPARPCTSPGGTWGAGEEEEAFTPLAPGHTNSRAVLAERARRRLRLPGCPSARGALRQTAAPGSRNTPPSLRARFCLLPRKPRLRGAHTHLQSPPITSFSDFLKCCSDGTFCAGTMKYSMPGPGGGRRGDRDRDRVRGGGRRRRG